MFPDFERQTGTTYFALREIENPLHMQAYDEHISLSHLACVSNLAYVSSSNLWPRDYVTLEREPERLIIWSNDTWSGKSSSILFLPCWSDTEIAMVHDHRDK